MCPFDNLVCLGLLRKNVSFSSKHLRCNVTYIVFLKWKCFPISASPFKISTVKAVTNAPQGHKVVIPGLVE